MTTLASRATANKRWTPVQAIARFDTLWTKEVDCIDYPEELLSQLEDADLRRPLGL